MSFKIFRLFLFGCLGVVIAGCAHTNTTSPNEDQDQHVISISVQAPKPPKLIAKPQTHNHQALNIYEALPQYEELLGKPWPALYPKSLPLKTGMRDPVVPKLRERLTLLGDLRLSNTMQPAIFDKTLARAVAHYQWRHGLLSDGVLGLKTIAALNVTPRERLTQLEKSMNRWAAFPDKEGSRYIVVNIPRYRLSVVENGDEALEMKVILGKSQRPTPTLYSKVETIVLNPKWNVPNSITRHDILPKVLKDPHYLEEHDIAVYSSWKKDAFEVDPNSIDWHKAYEEGFPYKLTQKPGWNNALGRVKFVFMNHHDVFMHDTPQKGLFKSLKRAYSSGCIRLEKPFKLVEYFLKDSDTLDQAQVDDILSQGQTKYLRIPNPIPIYITYITAWVDDSGIAHFREDVYGLDHPETSSPPLSETSALYKS